MTNLERLNSISDKEEMFVFLTKEKSCSGTAIPKATHNKIFYSKYIINSNKSQEG